MRKISGGNFIIMGVPGETVDAATARIIKRIQPSGFILFARNMKSPAQVRALTDQLRALVKHEPIITLDEEGGRVSRLRSIIGVESPSAELLRNCNDVSLVKRHGMLTARMLRMLGFNLNLAPVLDMDFDPAAENSLRGRHYGTHPEQVVANATAFVRGMRRHGVLCSGKHFPGYSAARVDPHKDIPVLERSLQQLESTEWVPFQQMLPLLDTVMTAHIQCESIGAGEPASLVSHVVRGVLRDKWNYKGCIITDDVDMGAVANRYGTLEATVRAVKAGNDLVLICHSLTELVAVSGAVAARVKKSDQEKSLQRILKMRKRLRAPTDFDEQKFAKLRREVEKFSESISQTLAAKQS